MKHYVHININKVSKLLPAFVNLTVAFVSFRLGMLWESVYGQHTAVIMDDDSDYECYDDSDDDVSSIGSRSLASPIPPPPPCSPDNRKITDRLVSNIVKNQPVARFDFSAIAEKMLSIR
jgi:hypothetical protein